MYEKQNDDNKKAHLSVLLYGGSKGEKLIKSMKNGLKCVLPENVRMRVTYSRTRLSSKFDINMILCIISNVQKINAQKSIKEKQHVETSRNAIKFSILILLFSPYKTWCKTRKNTREFHLYCWDMFVRCLVDCFHREFRVSTQIMVRVTASQNAKSFPPAEGNDPFNGLSGIFFFFFL